MFKIDLDANRITRLEEKRFGALNLRERNHLQEWIANTPDALGEELLIIQKEFDGFEDTKERLDLLADEFEDVVLNSGHQGGGNAVELICEFLGDDYFHDRKDAPEEAFGAELRWDRGDKDRKSSRIQFSKPFDGYDEENWPEMIEWLTLHIGRLEKTMAPLLAHAGQQLRQR